MPKKLAPGARVYSYIRFSTPEQAIGDSERRQLELARQFAARTGLPFDEKLRLADRGLSGFHGVHRKKGALGHFLKSVESGEVVTGSVLVVENMDRLSREGVVDALRTIVFGLIEKGITIQTLTPERAYSKESLNNGQAWELLGHIDRAHAESQRKSQFGQANWSKKRRDAYDDKLPITARCPAWLKPVWDMTKSRPRPVGFEVIEEAAESIRLMFEWKLNGLGNGTIESKLNQEAPWIPTPDKVKRKRSEGWRTSYIKKILTNPAVIGEYQPQQRITGRRLPIGEPIPNYYPAIVEPELFYAVQTKMKGNIYYGGRLGKNKNLLRHLVKCAYCGGSMAFADKGTPPKGQQYLICDNGRRRVSCARHTVRYDEVELAILSNCRHLQPEQVLPNPDEQAKLSKALRKRVQAKQAELQRTEEQVENLLDQITRTKAEELRDRYEAKLQTLTETQALLRSELADSEAQLRKSEVGQQSFKEWQTNFDTLLSSLKNGDGELRMRMHSHLRALIDRVEIFAIGFTTTERPDRRSAGWESLAEAIEDALVDYGKRKITTLTRKFLEHVTSRRMSKDGRFYRVRFKTGATVDVVPPGSIASGSQLVQDGKGRAWRLVGPDVEKLWEEFIVSEGLERGIRLSVPRG